MSAIPKLFESIILPKLNFYFSKYLIPHQHGFRLHRSTITNLMSYSNFLANAVENGDQVDSVYTIGSQPFMDYCPLFKKKKFQRPLFKKVIYYSNFIGLFIQIHNTCYDKKNI